MAPAISKLACFAWKTEKPTCEVSRLSSEFSILGAVCCLEVKCSREKNNETWYKVNLIKKTGEVCPQRNHANITTILELNTSAAGSITYCKNRIPIHVQSDTTIWRYTDKDLTEKYANFLNFDLAWKIICVFHDVSPPELKSGNLKVDSNASAEKCTQVSRDFPVIEKLSDVFSDNLLRQSLYPDAKLKCGDRTVPVHRAVLAVRSPVFDAMFRDASSDIFVTQLDDRILDLLLEYFYTGTVHALSDDVVVGLHAAAVKYAMEKLRDACSDWMIAHLTPDNCVHFLDAASSSDDKALEEAAVSLLCRHPDVLVSPDWIRLAGEHESFAYKLLYEYTLRQRSLRSTEVKT